MKNKEKRKQPVHIFFLTGYHSKSFLPSQITGFIDQSDIYIEEIIKVLKVNTYKKNPSMGKGQKQRIVFWTLSKIISLKLTGTGEKWMY